MHMADALLSPAVAGTMYACSTAVAAYSVTKIRKEDDQTKIPTMGIMGAFVFATQMINFTIPGTGSSGHLCGGMLLSAMLGAPAGFLTMIGILLIQCLMFADGGLMEHGILWMRHRSDGYMAHCDEKRRIKKENNGSVNYWLRCYFTTWSFFSNT